MKTIISITAFALAMGSTLALASPGQQGVGATAALSFDDLRKACTEPGRFHNQNAPSNIVIQCEDVQYKWKEADAGAFDMECDRYVTAALTSDKYTVSPHMSQLPASSQTGNCPKFKRVKEVVTFSKSIGCGDLVKFPGTATEYCTTLVNDVRAANPLGIQTQETEEVIDTCLLNTDLLKKEKHSQSGQAGRGQR